MRVLKTIPILLVCVLLTTHGYSGENAPGGITVTGPVSGDQEGKLPGKGESAMERLDTKRLILRTFTHNDWRDVHVLAVDWSKAPGPAFDKWPTTEEGAKGLTNHFVKDNRYFAMCLRETEKVVGLLALNGIDASKQLDLGHVILSKYQDNDHDKEALEAMVDCVFRSKGALSIVTHNASKHREQLAPLRSLGFRNINEENKGELVITKAEWEKQDWR